MHTATAAFYDFKSRALPSSPNYCLVDKNINSKRHIKAPVYNISVLQLKQNWDAMISKQPRTKLIKSKNNACQYVQHSKIFGFPDIIDVEFIALTDNKSTLKIFSHSLKGYYDFGVNCRRLKLWLTKLRNK